MAKAKKSSTGSRSSRPASKNSTTSTTNRGGNRGGGVMMGRSGSAERTMLEELFMDELKDIYWAEKHLTKALPRMSKASTSPELSKAFDKHLKVTEGQIKRLEKVFQRLGVAAKAKKCEAMEGLVSEAQNLLGELPKGTAARDAGLIIAAQKVEHYEIAAYGSMVQLAKTMGQTDIADLLYQTLEEEKMADELLTQVAEAAINIEAEEEPA